ncbi:helix-turn-helix domain-containing protein [Pseudonocardia lutea]|uniref:Helix-turn-helix domain-containing protein n=1 Tax=Pseudonocardia lutea TaxID=2172015 RepID=A0ABW1I536_9PSEU
MYATIDRVDTPDAMAGAVVALRMGGVDLQRRARTGPPDLSAMPPGRSPAWPRYLEHAVEAVASGQHVLRRLSELEQVESAATISALHTANSNKKAADDLGISRSTLYRRLVVLDIF